MFRKPLDHWLSQVRAMPVYSRARCACGGTLHVGQGDGFQYTPTYCANTGLPWHRCREQSNTPGGHMNEHPNESAIRRAVETLPTAGGCCHYCGQKATSVTATLVCDEHSAAPTDTTDGGSDDR